MTVPLLVVSRAQEAGERETYTGGA